MADITVTSYYRDVDHFQSRTAPIYVYTVAPDVGTSNPSSGIVWHQEGANRIGIYRDSGSITAEPEFKYTNSTGSLLIGGTPTSSSISLYTFGEAYAFDIEHSTTGVFTIGKYSDTFVRVGGATYDFQITGNTFLDGECTISDLTGTGTRVIVASATGVLSTPSDLKFASATSNLSLGGSTSVSILSLFASSETYAFDIQHTAAGVLTCLLYTSPSPRDRS